MIELSSQPLYDTIIAHCASARKRIRLCSPFVKSEIITPILAANVNSVPIELITNLNLNSLHKRASDIDSIGSLLAAGHKVFTFTTLHAKFYTFDEKLAVISSANLTPSGMLRNWEYGVVTDEPYLVQAAIRDFDCLRGDELTGRIKQEHLVLIADILDRIPPAPKQVLPRLHLEFTEYENVIDEDDAVIAARLRGWKRSVFEEITKLGLREFSTAEVKVMARALEEKYPNNRNIEPKIRQQLQFLRDLGLVQFTSPGHYKRLWR